ncbi:hypothetical protein Trydic_g2612 [Trypoxylus dichotomus]
MTLRRLLFDMGFCYEKNGNKSILVEKDQKNVNTKANNPKICTKKAMNSCNDNSSVSSGQLNGQNLSNKPNTQLHHENINPHPPNHIHPVNNYQGHRIMHTHISQPENHHIIPPQTQHNIPMMIDHRNNFIPLQHSHPSPLLQIRPSNMDIGIKRDNSVWMQQVHSPIGPLPMVKQ